MFVWIPKSPTTPPSPVSLRAARLIVIALGMGLTLFLSLVCFLRLAGHVEPDTTLGAIVAYAAHGLAVMLLAPLFFVRARFSKVIQQQSASVRTDAEKGLVAPPVMSMTIISAAMVEGVGLFGTLSLLLGAPWWAIGLPLVCIVVIWWMAPSQATLREAVR
jgi:hypothetical protein